MVNNVGVGQDQIRDRTEAWLYLGVIAHLMLLVGTAAGSLTLSLGHRTTPAIEWSTSLPSDPNQHVIHIPVVLPLYAWGLFGVVVCGGLFALRTWRRRLKPVRALGEALAVALGRQKP
jgi:hypothetical protein